MSLPLPRVGLVNKGFTLNVPSRGSGVSPLDNRLGSPHQPDEELSSKC